MTEKLQVYAVNLAARTERRESIIGEFEGRDEFELHIVPAIEHRNGPYGLWQTFYGIVEEQERRGSEFFIFCEDDHVFTEAYSQDTLLHYIRIAQSLDADLLSGGMSVCRNPVEVAPGLFWVNWFNGMQFTVIFRRCYPKILAAKTTEGYAVDIQLSYLAKRKYVMAPYISIQREFGYSDATSINEEEGRVTRFFQKNESLLAQLHKVRNHYSAISPDTLRAIMSADVSRAFIPTYVINLPERTDRLEHIRKEFEGRPEFDLHIVEASRHEIGAIGLWQSICRIITEAKESDEDFVLICEDDHFFTEAYNRERLLHQIMLAGAMGAQMLSGGIGDFSNLVPLPGGVAWIDRFWCTQFIVIYRNAYDLILSAPFSLRDVADEKLSALLTAKMVTVPFISEQTDFGYSDITESNNHDSMIRRHFDNARVKLRHYPMAFKTAAEQPNPVSIAEYLAGDGPKALQLGCGMNQLPGWLNTDVEPDYGVTFLDVTQPIPAPDRSFDFIFAEHLIENFGPERLKKVLSECFRILTPGGTLRLTFYCADALRKMPDSKQINAFIARLSKAYLHLGSEICTLLSESGFDHINLTSPNESTHQELQNVNKHNPYLPKEQYLKESTTIEAQKPH
ncbi:MAG: methyltransferase domain-containing protein [Bacteroides sp.]|nr:methyltransferase domain-containing protein [Bacteroides sp.]